MSRKIGEKLAEAIKALQELLEALGPHEPAPEFAPIPVRDDKPRRKI